MVTFGHGPEGIVNPLLHLGIGTLYCIELYGAVIGSGINRRDSPSAHSDPVIVAAEEHDQVTLFRCILGAVGFFPEADSARKHYHLVKAVALHVSEVFEGQHRAADKRLTELVPEVARAIGSLDQYLFRCLVKPFARFTVFFPLAGSVWSGIGCHIDCCAGNGE